MFTYDPTLVDSISKLRFFLRDTNEAYPMFQDEELLFLLTESANNVYKAASEAAFVMYTEFTTLSTVAEADDIRIESRDKAKWFKEVYEEFKVRAMRDRVPPILVNGGDRTSFINASEGRSLLENRSATETNTFFDLN